MTRILWAMICAAVLGAACPLFANAADVSIEPQPLGSALQDLAKQSDVQIIFFSKAVEGRRAPALSGTYTPEEAVARLLEGSDLTYHVLNDRTIEVAAKPVTPAPPSPVTAGLAAPLDEVKVIAEREKLNAMREELRKLEEQFFAAYNKANTRPEYEIVCKTEASRSGRLTQRFCEPAFLIEAMRDAEEFACPNVIRTGSHVGRRDSSGKCSVTAVRCANPATRTKVPDYQKSMTEILARNAELRRLLEERQKLAERYDALLKQSLGGAAPEHMATTSRVSSVALAPCPHRPAGRARSDGGGFEYPIQSGPATVTFGEQAALHGVAWPP